MLARDVVAASRTVQLAARHPWIAMLVILGAVFGTNVGSDAIHGDDQAKEIATKAASLVAPLVKAETDALREDVRELKTSQREAQKDSVASFNKLAENVKQIEDTIRSNLPDLKERTSKNERDLLDIRKYHEDVHADRLEKNAWMRETNRRLDTCEAAMRAQRR